MEKNNNTRSFLFLLLISIVISLLFFRNWFLAKDIIGGDWPYYSHELLQRFQFFPPAWVSDEINGFGGQIITYPISSYVYFIVSLFVNLLHIPWAIVYKILIFGMFIFLSIFSSISLATFFLLNCNPWQKFTAALIYTTNTYILMLVGGGQMGVALAYAIAPLVVVVCTKLVDYSINESLHMKFSIIAGMILAAQIMFDLRIAALTLGIVVLFLVLSLVEEKSRIRSAVFYRLLYQFLIVGGVASLLHASWLLPLLLAHTNPLDSLVAKLNSIDGFRFFSFADFSHSLSLLHPNWYENIFGKTYFMRPEFIFLPIIAFSSLFLLKSDRRIIFFSFLALLGAFLAKGANPPFGVINEWLFIHVPLLQILRDPTKFYSFTALSYAILIPFTLGQIPRKVRIAAICVFLILWFFTIRQAVTGQLGGTFAQHSVPQEYISLANKISGDSEFYRTLWMPRQSRFAYYSNYHPTVEAAIFLNATNSSELAHAFQADTLAEKISKGAIKYVIVPYDSLGEIFVKDRKYDDVQYEQVINVLNHTKWLKKIEGFEKLAVYEVPNPNSHFYFTGLNQGKIPDIKQLSTTSYVLSYSADKPVDLVFSENYSPYWKAKIENTVVASEKSTDNFNVFPIKETGNVYVQVHFELERYYNAGQIIAILTFCACVLVLFMPVNKKKI